MKVTKRTLMGWGAIALAVSLLILAAPKAAHAIVVTLVQVANTSANPAITQDVSRLPSQSVQLMCTATFIDCQQILLNGSLASNYSVPTGSSLVITTVQINISSTGTNTVELRVTGGIRGTWVLNSTGTFEFQYPSGIVFFSGATPIVGGLGGNDQTFLIGYLVSN
jgi:hypothetical protein